MMANLLPVFGLTLLFALATSKEAHLVLLENHGEAVCLDGSPPGYYFRPGTGTGATKFIVHLEGGGDCESKEECYQRSMTGLGSSSYWSKTADFDGFLSGLEQTNKYFYNWNLVFVKYCDGSCYSGYLSKPFHVYGTPIYFKGNLIVKAIFKSLIEKEFKEATDVILTGCSAGGLGTFIFADYVKSVLPSSIKYRAIADAGYFINSLNINGEPIAKERAKTTFVFQNQTISLHKECAKKYTGDEAYNCIRPQFLYPFIKTPIFTFNSQYDTWQVQNNLQLDCTPPNCSPEEMKKLQGFFKEFQATETNIVNSTTNGAFLDSCLAHCQSLDSHGWNEVKVGGQSAAETFANWYFGKSGGSVKEVDCPYPCNKSC